MPPFCGHHGRGTVEGTDLPQRNKNELNELCSGLSPEQKCFHWSQDCVEGLTRTVTERDGRGQRHSKTEACGLDKPVRGTDSDRRE